jgi:hypothetical protein
MKMKIIHKCFTCSPCRNRIIVVESMFKHCHLHLYKICPCQTSTELPHVYNTQKIKKNNSMLNKFSLIITQNQLIDHW